MPFVPHTAKDIQEMLQTIGAKRIEDLFDEIPDSLRHASLDAIPNGISEMGLTQEMKARAKQDLSAISFMGAGAYEHHIPAVVWEVATRGEFYTAYTPYQAEASQGSLQLIYEYQTMMTRLMSMDVSNASLYDGASALAEAILMAVRIAHQKTKSSILMPLTIHPLYRETVRAIVRQQDITLIDVPYNASTGQVDVSSLDALCREDTVALVIPQPNFFGVLEEVDVLTRFAAQKKLLSIAVVNPTAMALLKPPGEWGDEGVDIVCGEGQPLGIPLASGGPYYGFMCCKQTHVRQMPGRIVGRTVDVEGKPGFVLTLQAREQHIRRAKATSNICTNQGLMVTASTVYMSLLGPEGLKQVSLASHANTRSLQAALIGIPGVEKVFASPFFHEVVLRMNQSVPALLHSLAKRGIQGGIALETFYPELKNCLLVCATETKTAEDIEKFAQEIKEYLIGTTTKQTAGEPCQH